MKTKTVDEIGRVVIPRDMLKELGILYGERVVISLEQDSIVIKAL